MGHMETPSRLLQPQDQALVGRHAPRHTPTRGTSGLHWEPSSGAKGPWPLNPKRSLRRRGSGSCDAGSEAEAGGPPDCRAVPAAGLPARAGLPVVWGKSQESYGEEPGGGPWSDLASRRQNPCSSTTRRAGR